MTLMFSGQVVILTGVGPGLGTTLARRFAEQGADVAVVARTADTLRTAVEQAEQCGQRGLAVPADVTDRDAMRRMADIVAGEFGKIDVLVNSAFPGTYRKHVLDMDDDYLELWRRQIDIGAYGTMLASRFVAPYMVRAGRGSIVNVTSMSSRRGYAGRSDYGAGKSAAHAVAQALADELGPLGIRVNCVAPGLIWSDVLRRWIADTAAEQGISYDEMLAHHVAQMALRRVVTEDEVANAILFLASGQASGITGTTIDVNAGQVFD
jgi:NAD(P)-dependent dehydrogenase (short-subunit alcohol dehydrogenase family)